MAKFEHITTRVAKADGRTEHTDKRGTKCFASFNAFKRWNRSKMAQQSVANSLRKTVSQMVTNVKADSVKTLKNKGRLLSETLQVMYLAKDTALNEIKADRRVFCN